MNFITGKVDGSEECLYLNVYAPASKKGLLPVMVGVLIKLEFSCMHLCLVPIFEFFPSYVSFGYTVERSYLEQLIDTIQVICLMKMSFW